MAGKKKKGGKKKVTQVEDVDMKDATKSTDDEVTKVTKKTDPELVDPEVAAAAAAAAAKAAALDALHANIQLIAKSVAKKERQHTIRVLRLFYGTRKALTVKHITAILEKYSPADINLLPVDKLPVEMEAEKPTVEETPKAEKEEDKIKDADKKDEKKEEEKKEEEKKEEEEVFDVGVPEVRVYVLLLLTAFLLDKKVDQESAVVATTCFDLVQSQNRRTMDLLSEKVYSFYSLAYERLGKLSDCRSNLLYAHRTACLHHNEPGQASLTVCILRNFLHYNLYNQADKFRSNTTFPESRSNNLHARFLYYTGKINSVQLHYSDAFKEISQAIRKAPQQGALGFRQKAHKLLVIVQLLMGDIPERTVFSTTGLEKSLLPYFQLTQAVRVGDLIKFGVVVKQFKADFIKDGVYSLIVRLRHNVIKTGLRRINLAYSRISIQDICQKLNLPSEEDAEYIVAKAIHDGVIDAVIDRKEHFLFSKENSDIYSTQEPQLAFHRRAQFCMEIYSNSLKAMRYPEDAHKPKKGPGLGEDDEDDKKEIDLEDLEDEGDSM